MKRIKDFLRSEVFIEGLNFENMLNSLLKHGVEIFRLQKIDSTHIKFEVFDSKALKIIDLYADSCYNVCVRKLPSIFRFWDYAKQHIGILIGAFILLVMCVLYSQFIWQIKVVGLERGKNESIVQALNNSGVHVGSLKNSANLAELSNFLSESFDDIGLVSVNIVGTSLIVNIFERPFVEELHDSGRIYSNFDGVITRINLFSGTCLVEVGQKVESGQLLVDSYIRDSSGVVQNVSARAEIFADVYYTKTQVFDENEQYFERTGESYTSKVLIMLGQTNDKHAISPYKYYETETVQQPINYRNGIPIKLEMLIFYELKEIVRYAKFKDVQSEIVAKLKEQVRDGIPMGLEIIEEFINITPYEGKYLISVSIQTNQRIDVQK